MFITAKLVFEHYIPDTLTKGMMFKQRIKDVIYGNVYEYDKVFTMDASFPMSSQDFDSFLQVHGYPVMPRIMTITANPDEPAVTLATAEQIGWWDEDPSSDEMRDIELKDINMILSDYNSEVEIEVEDAYITSDDDDEEIIIPILYMDKVTLSYPGAHDWEDYEDDEYWDEMDDNYDEPDTDSAGFTQEDRCPKYDSDHDTE